MMMWESFAPGRVELLGNHTDYNEGFVLSAAIELGTTVRARPRSRGFVLRSESHETVETERLERTGTWADYCLGVIALLQGEGIWAGALEIEVQSDLPSGMGLSSSAALEVATAFLVCDMAGRFLPPLDLARLCRRAENEFVGVACGLLDQATSIFGENGRILFLDFRQETYRTLPFPPGCAMLAIHSGVKHALVGGEYNERRQACMEAARRLGAAALRDVNEQQLETAGLPEKILARARHVVGENRRVLEALGALESADAATFGALMLESHASSRTHFENSTPELDCLVELTAAQEGVFGARLTGGGFGGGIVAVGIEEALRRAAPTIVESYQKATGHRAEARLLHPSAGALATRPKRP